MEGSGTRYIFLISPRITLSSSAIPLFLQIVYRIGEDREPHRGPGRRTGEMINAGLAEYAALLTGIGGTTLTSVEPTMTVIAIVGGIIFLFWLIVFKL